MRGNKMSVTIIQQGHSHASCHVVITLAAKSLLNKLPESSEDIERLKLDKDELELLNQVISKFDAKKQKQQK